MPNFQALGYKANGLFPRMGLAVRDEFVWQSKCGSLVQDRTGRILGKCIGEGKEPRIARMIVS